MVVGVLLMLILEHLWCARLIMSTLSAVGVVTVGEWESGLTLMGICSLGLVIQKLPMLTSVGVATLIKYD
jgi:hypothetical protein